MMKLRNDLVSDTIYEMLGPMPEAFYALYDLIDTMPGLTRPQRRDIQMLVDAVYLDAVEQAFALGWKLRTDPTPLLFEEK